MIKRSKLLTLAASLIFSHSASAVIIEGSFSGQTWDLWTENMESTPDANFWATARFGYFSGTFWYDTTLAGPATLNNQWGETSASYAGPHDWLHTTLTFDGASLDLTSSGNFPAHLRPTRETILVQQDDFPAVDGFPATHNEALTLRYEDVSNPDINREAWLSFGSSETPFLQGLGLIQNASLGPILDGDTVVGTIYFNEHCNTADCNHNAFFAAEINAFDIHVRAPEPSPLLLLLGPLALLVWRTRIKH